MLTRTELLVVAFFILLTGSLSLISTNKNAGVANAEFRRLTEDSVGVLRSRTSMYLQSIKGTAAFLSASDYVSSDDFDVYVKGLEVSEQLPGLNGIGLVVEVPDADLDSFVAEMRDKNQQGFSVKRRSNETTHYIIKYFYPQENNTEALGLDVTYSAEIKAIMDKARDTGTTMMSPPIRLVQDDLGGPSFVLYLPIFDRNASGDFSGTFLGWVDAPFTANNLFVNLSSSEDVNYYLSVLDGDPKTKGTNIYDSHDDGLQVGKYSATYEINEFGRTWTLTYKSTAKFDRSFLPYQPLGLLIVGLIVTTLIFLALRSMRLQSEALHKVAELRVRQIKAREEETRSIVENSVVSVLVVDGTDRILFANHGAQTCFGYSETEINKLHFASLATTLDEPLENHNAIGFTKSGKTIELDLQKNDWLTIDGAARSTIIISDLTEQNRAQCELRRNRALYDLALRGAEIGVFDIDLTTGRSEVSPTWCRIMGFADGTTKLDTQRLFLSRVHPEDIEILRTANIDCIEGRTGRSIAEYRLKSVDNTWRWMRSDAVVVERDKDGKALRLIGTQRDITGLRRDRNALAASEQRFRQVLAHAPIGMALLDYHGNFTGVNDAFCQMTGMSEQNLISKVRLPDLMPYEDRKAVYIAITTLIENGNASLYTAEHRILHAKGEDRWGLVNVSWSFDENSSSYFFIAQVIDITEQKKLNLLKSEFVSTVSHELRTPLTSIKGALSLLAASRDAGWSEGATRLIKIACSNTDRLANIVNDILDLEKITSGELVFKFDDIDLGEVLRVTMMEMLPFALTHENELRIEIPPEPLFVHADEGRTKQVLANLISNACKYSDADTEVVVRVESKGGYAIIYVENTGPGIPESFKSRIFKAFSQVDGSVTRAKGGTGLGLNISQQIVRRQGGEIGYESKQNDITVFWFSIPVTSAARNSRDDLQVLEGSK